MHKAESVRYVDGRKRSAGAAIYYGCQLIMTIKQEQFVACCVIAAMER